MVRTTTDWKHLAPDVLVEGLVVRHHTQSHDEALEFNGTFDLLYGSRTSYHRLPLSEISPHVWKGRVDIAVHARIKEIIDIIGLDGTGLVQISAETVRSQNNQALRKAFNSLFSMVKLGQSGPFVSPICILRVNGTTSIHPGKTRILYQRTHPELIDVMLTSFEDDFVLPERIETLNAFEKLCEFKIRPFDAGRSHRTRYLDLTKVYKEIEPDSTNQYRPEKHAILRVLVTRGEFFVNGDMVAFRQNGKWVLP